MEKRFSKQEQICEETFRETTFRENGRFVLILPVKGELELGRSFVGYLEKRLSRNEACKNHYNAFMEDYLEEDYHIGTYDKKNQEGL